MRYNKEFFGKFFEEHGNQFTTDSGSVIFIYFDGYEGDSITPDVDYDTVKLQVIADTVLHVKATRSDEGDIRRNDYFIPFEDISQIKLEDKKESRDDE